jgi:hypothetical protein
MSSQDQLGSNGGVAVVADDNDLHLLIVIGQTCSPDEAKLTVTQLNAGKNII